MQDLVGALGRKAMKDVQRIEQMYLAEVRSKSLDMQSLLAELAAKNEELLEAARVSNQMKNKLTSDYLCIKDLKQTLNFTQDHLGIITTENARLTEIIMNFKDNLVRPPDPRKNSSSSTSSRRSSASTPGSRPPCRKKSSSSTSAVISSKNTIGTKATNEISTTHSRT